MGILSHVLYGDFDFVKGLSTGVQSGVGGTAMGFLLSIGLGSESLYGKTVRNFSNLAGFGIAIGIAFGVLGGIIGVSEGIPVGTVRSGWVWSVGLGMGFGLLLGLLFNIASGDLAVGSIAGVSTSVGIGVLLALALSFVRDIGTGLMFGISAGLTLLVGVLRVPIYFVEVLVSVWSYNEARLSPQSSGYLTRSPVYWDEYLILPQPFLSSMLLISARSRLGTGLGHIARVADNPFQRWAAHRSLLVLVERDNIPFFYLADYFLRGCLKSGKIAAWQSGNPISLI